MTLSNREKVDIAAFVQHITQGLKLAFPQKDIQFSDEMAQKESGAWVTPDKLKSALNPLFTFAAEHVMAGKTLHVHVSGSEKYIRIEIAGADFSTVRQQIGSFLQEENENAEVMPVSNPQEKWPDRLREVLDFHRAKIWMEESGEGQQCVIALPRDLRKKVKVVVADDNPGICRTLQDILSEKEYEVDTVKNGYELIAYLRENSPRVVILDLMMPEKDGTEVFNTIRNIQSGAKIIIYTGFHRFENSPYAKNAERFLIKDENPEKLIQAIEELS
ncbi:MAG: response regulator [Candidatus Omnitrophica bacterium]|nr:response regulator [Candidatus Omnitrophota bacterium]